MRETYGVLGFLALWFMRASESAEGRKFKRREEMEWKQNLGFVKL